MTCSGSDTRDATDNYIHEKSIVGQEKPHGAGSDPSDAVALKGTGEHLSCRGAWGWHGHVRDGNGDGTSRWVQSLGPIHAAIGKTLLGCGRFAWKSDASATAQPGEAHPKELPV